MESMFYLLKWKNNLSIEDIILKLREKDYLPNTLTCPNCGSEMVIHRDSSRKDHFRWVCKRCRKRRPIRVNTWAAKYRIPFTELYILVRYYVENENINLISKKLKIENEVIVSFFDDLDGFIPTYTSKLHFILNECGANREVRETFKNNKGNFRDLSRIFSLSVIFNVILETLQGES